MVTIEKVIDWTIPPFSVTSGFLPMESYLLVTEKQSGL